MLPVRVGAGARRSLLGVKSGARRCRCAYVPVRVDPVRDKDTRKVIGVKNNKRSAYR